LLFGLTFLFCIGCYKLEIEEGTPECIEDLICEFDKNTSCENGVNVMRFSFQEQKVYVFDSGFCIVDSGVNVYNSECTYLGTLGGIAGTTTINGEEFSNAIFESMVWER